MNPLIRASAALAASAAVLTFACATFGQDQPATPRQPPTAEQRAEWRQQHEAERAQRLTAVLNLRADQQPALQAFLAAMKPTHEGHEGPKTGEAQDAMTTPQRLDQMADRMARHETAFRQRADAIRTFYAALSADQQKAFDALPMLMGGDHQRGGHGEHHGEHDGTPMGPPPAGASS